MDSSEPNTENTNNEESTMKEDKEPTAEPKKKPSNNEKNNKEVLGRQKSKTLNTNTFEQGKPQVKSQAKPIETIGENKFKNLIGMFDKNKQNNQNNPNSTTPSYTGPTVTKMNNEKLSVFNPVSNSSKVLDSKPEVNVGMSNSIKERMENFLKLGKDKDQKTSSVASDPVLQGYKKAVEEKVEEEGEEHGNVSGGDADDLDISGDHDEKKEEEDKDNNNPNNNNPNQEKKENDVDDLDISGDHDEKKEEEDKDTNNPNNNNPNQEMKENDVDAGNENKENQLSEDKNEGNEKTNTDDLI